MSQARTSNKDKDGNKQVLDKVWQSVSPGRYREAEDYRQGKESCIRLNIRLKTLELDPQATGCWMES